jgi:mRNA-degrading endonuclease toxin of MazEF toxin-antitoxin module
VPKRTGDAPSRQTDGLPNTCAANFDNLQTVPKSNIGARIARLTSRKMKEAVAAISFALALDED